MSNDNSFKLFLERQTQEALALAAASDLLHLEPIGSPPAQHFIAQFNCRGLVSEHGKIIEADRFLVGYQFPSDYLRRVNSRALVTILAPMSVYHPNCAGPAICLGELPPGTGLVDLLYSTYEVLNYGKLTPREDNALNPTACAWARQNMDSFPTDRRPLKWRADSATPPVSPAGPQTSADGVST